MHSSRAFCAAILATVCGWGCGSDGPGIKAADGGSAGGAGVANAGGSPSSGGSAGAAGSGAGGVPQAVAGAGGVAAGGANAAAGTSGAGGGADAGANPHPLLDVLAKFTAPDVPVRGPKEADPKPRNYSGTVPTRPGKGLAQHPMLYVGESYNRILLTNGGKVIWTYDTQGGNELDDVWMLSNGNVLYSHMTYIEELTPKKDVVWHYDPPAGSEIHTCQPIGLDKVLIGLNQVPSPKLQLINIHTNAIEIEHAFPDGQSDSAHGELRRMRMTKDGTYLFSWLIKAKAVEYDKGFNAIHTFATPQPWSVTRLHNGNTLIMDERESTCKEMDSQGNLVWSFKKSEINVPGAQLGGNTQTCERLASGNTVMFFHSTPGNLQAVEVTPTKEVVWALEDWKDLGDATSAQFLDEPGIPEVPGDTEH